MKWGGLTKDQHISVDDVRSKYSHLSDFYNLYTPPHTQSTKVTFLLQIIPTYMT